MNTVGYSLCSLESCTAACLLWDFDHLKAVIIACCEQINQHLINRAIGHFNQ